LAVRIYFTQFCWEIDRYVLNLLHSIFYTLFLRLSVTNFLGLLCQLFSLFYCPFWVNDRLPFKGILKKHGCWYVLAYVSMFLNACILTNSPNSFVKLKLSSLSFVVLLKRRNVCWHNFCPTPVVCSWWLEKKLTYGFMFN